ncbi:MAG TPA: PAS domain S-box protein [Opitutaceae bacterium]
MPSHPTGSPTASEAESALLARAHELEAIGENFPEGALYQYTMFPDGRRLLTHLGRSAERIFGELPDALPVDVSWLSARIHPDDEPACAAAGEIARYAMMPFHHEVRVRSRTGSERWISIRSQPRTEEDGRIVWDGALIDVTDRRGMEDAVRRQAEFLSALNETTLELLGRRKVSELLQALAERTAALLRCPHAEISLLEDGVLVVRAFSRGHEYLMGDRLARGEPALSWRAVDTGRPAVVDCYQEHPESRAVYRTRGIHAAAVIPIMRAGECVGVLGLGRDRPDRPFTSEDIQEGVLLAQMAALTLHNTAIYEEAVRETEARTAAHRESEERFRAVFAQSPVMHVLVAVQEARIAEANDALLAGFGYAREEMIGRTTLELGLWLHAAQRDEFLRRLQAYGVVRNYEAEMRRRNGTAITVILSVSLITLAGRTYGLAAVEEITDRKRFEAARDRTHALMRATLESTADGILVVSAGGRIETYNHNFAEMWGLPPDYIASDRNEAHLLHTVLGQLDEPERFLASVRDLYSGSEDEVFDILLCKDGRIFERFSRPQILNGRPAGRVWSLRDITDQRRAEAALRESEERFRVLAEVSPVGIFSSDPGGRTVFVNRRWCELAGLTPEQALGEGWKTALHPDDRQGVADNWAQAVKHGESSAAEFRFVRPDGAISWLVGQSRAQRHADGTLAGYVGTITDVTHLKRAEEERKRLEAQQRQSRKMESLGTLAGGIAHDFNNILTGTFGFVELAAETLPPGHPAHQWLDRIGTSSRRARDLVRQILTFSRKTEGALVPQRLAPVVAEALRLLQSTLPPLVTLEHALSSQAPPVLADASQIHQVVVNLCTNAWHALADQPGRIVVALEPLIVSLDQARANPDLRPGPVVRLSVTDTGCGMDATTLDRLFEPFFTTKAPGAGTGLGLAVVHGIVKSHHGAIVVRTIVGGGSTFEIYFPVAQLDTAAPAPASPPEIPRGRGQRILVVDDDPVSGFAIEKMIERLGYQVTRFNRPEEALAAFAKAPTSYDLVVSDLAMPLMNGAEMLERMQQFNPGLAAIIVTGFIEAERQRLFERSVARMVLHKPVTREDLARAVAHHVRGGAGNPR